MGRAFITDMQMPHEYCYWALCQFVKVLKAFLLLLTNWFMALNQIYVALPYVFHWVLPLFIRWASSPQWCLSS
jgi:hypothetical protein